MIRRFKNFIKFLEKDRLSFFGIFILVLFVGFIRGYVEGVCVYGYFNRGLTANDMMCSLAAFFGGTLILSIFAKEKIKKVMNASILFWWIFILPPVIDFLFFGGCSNFFYGFAPFEVIKQSPSLIFLFPLFVIKSGYAPGLFVETILVVILSLVYIYVKTKSIKSILFFAILGFLFGQIMSNMPIFYFFISKYILTFKLLPAAYEWFFLLFLVFSLLILSTKRKFIKNFIKKVNPLIVFIPFLVIWGTMLTHPRFLNLLRLFVKIVISLCLWCSLSIFSNFKIEGIKIKDIFLDNSRKINPNKRFFEFAIILQVISIVSSTFYFLFVDDVILLPLALLSVLLIYLYAFVKKFKVPGLLFFDFLAIISFLIGYSNKITLDGMLFDPIIRLRLPIIFVLFSISLLIYKYYICKKASKRL